MKNEKGVMLLLTVFIILFMAVLIIGYLQSATTETEIMRNHRTTAKAVYVTEGGLQAGIRYIIDNLLTDDDWSDNYADWTYIYTNVSLGEGDYDVELKSIATDKIDVRATGEVSSFTRCIIQTVTKTSSIEAFSYVQHTDNNINFNNSNGTVTGNLSAAGNVNNESGMTINGTITESSSVECPDVNYASYKAIADYVYTSNHTFNSGTYSGIYYCTKNVTVKGNVTLTGTIISEGKITFNGDNTTITRSSNYPALVANNNISSDNDDDITITGLVYSEGKIVLKNGSDITITGAMVNKNTITLTNDPSLIITYDSNIASSPPPYFSGGGASSGVSLSDWQES